MEESVDPAARVVRHRHSGCCSSVLCCRVRPSESRNVNPRENLDRLILPAEGDRISDIVEREGGSKFSDDMTWTCCGLTVRGASADVLAAAAAHKQAVHPQVKKRRFATLKERQDASRPIGNIASRRTDEGE